MFSNIMSCTRCALHQNQLPLLDKKYKADVFWVGLSAKKVEDIENDIPLSNDTNSGKIINRIESRFEEEIFYRTNLVKCVPLDRQGKLRYPDKKEKKVCFNNLLYEINLINPKIVFLLGKEVANFILSNNGVDNYHLDEEYNYETYLLNGIFYVPVHHPSFIHVYRRKRIDEYINGISDIIYNTCINEDSSAQVAI